MIIVSPATHDNCMHLPLHSRAHYSLHYHLQLLFNLLLHTAIEQCCVLRLCIFDFLSSAIACSGHIGKLALIAAVVVYAGSI